MNTVQLPSITIEQSSKIVGVSQQTIRRWIKSGQLRAVKIGGRYKTTVEWIRELPIAVGNYGMSGSGGKNENDSYESATRNLRSKFGLDAKKMPRG